MSVEALLSQALEAHRRGALAQAEQGYRAVLARQPDQADALALLGLVLEARKAYPEALACIVRAMALDPSAPLFPFYLGNVKMASGDPAGAADAFRAAIALHPDRPEFHYNLGNALRAQSLWAEAQTAYEQTLKLDPNHVLARNNLALVYEHDGALDAAVELLAQVTSLAPDYGEGWLNLCNLAEKAGQYETSLAAGQKAAALMPQNASAWFGSGVALNRLQRDEEALAAYRTSLALRPDWAEAWDNLGQTFQFLNRLEEARDAFRKVLEVSGQMIADEDSRRVEEKEYGNHHWHLALLELLMGDLRRGFARYRARFEDVGGLQRPTYDAPVWQGEPLEGKTILITDEQGMGDCLMMARYLPLLRAQGAHVKFLVHPALAPLFEGWDGATEVIARGKTADLGAFDYHASIFDLPYGFQTTLETIPSACPYLPVLPPDAHTDLSAYKGRKIGVAWGGAPLHKQDLKRSVPLGIFARIFDGAGATFFSLNRDKRAGDDALLSSLPVVDLAPRLNNFADTSRFMAQMDLVISCDTSTAHLAGGMGKPVWTLLPYAPDWRWLCDRADSPWYPTMRLFRQTERGNWEGVMDRVRAALDA